jgi:lipopolysaccharide transport system ATP-binding protein
MTAITTLARSAEPVAPPQGDSAAVLPAAAPEAPLVVRVERLGKCFRIYRRPLDRVWEWLGGGVRHTDFWAIRGVSFDVRKGDCLGIIGANGSGKSTLLKMISGALYPTEGSFTVNGLVLSLIELGTGLNPQLSGRENIVHAAALLGFPADFARMRMEEIRAFAELGDFFERPVNLYSSGMRVRLAFSMFACFRPEVFIVDEALSVGDVFFQQKCATRIRELLDDGMTMIFVSHDQSAVLNLCDRALVLSQGAPIFYGEPEEAVSRYIASLHMQGTQRWTRPTDDAPGSKAPARGGRARTDKESAIVANDVIGSRREHRHGTGALQIVAARVTNGAGEDTMRAMLGETLRFEVLLEASERVESPRAGIRFFDRFNNLVFGAGTYQVGLNLSPMEAGQRVAVRFDVTMDLEPGQYTFGLGAGEPADGSVNAGLAHDRIDLLGPVIVAIVREQVRPFYGVARLPMRASVTTPDRQETPT